MMSQKIIRCHKEKLEFNKRIQIKNLIILYIDTLDTQAFIYLTSPKPAVPTARPTGRWRSTSHSDRTINKIRVHQFPNPVGSDQSD